MIVRKTTYIILLITAFGCSTSKNTWLSRNYHNLTAYYNIYFNGKEALNEGVKNIREEYPNDYSRILPMFESSDPNAIGIATGNMDRAIEKGTKLIKKHSISAKPKKRSGSRNDRSNDFYSKNEYNEWVDDAYLLIGKAQFYKHEFLPAIRTFQYVIREYNNTPAQYEGLIWLARAYTEYHDYIGALSALESYDLGANAPEYLYADFMACYANLLLKQGKYTEAIPYLKNNIINNKNRVQKIRFSYILGQLYLKSNQKEEAVDVFSYVAKASPDYEMTFNAKINKASVIHDNVDIEEIKKQLHKLRRDKKNKDYLDRIYWAFGQIAEQEEQYDEALAYYKKSVESSVDNDKQKGRSFNDAATIYYKRFDYPNAYFYYDSALTVLDEDYETFDELVERRDGLSSLVENILIVQREDSLQRLATMDKPVLLAYLDDIINAKKEEIEKEQAKQREQEEDFNDPFFYQNTSNQQAQSQAGGKWYFYNPNSMSMGKMEFQKRWGKRKLEDNWRRSDKSKNLEERPELNDPFSLPNNPFAADDDKKQQKTETQDAIQTASDTNNQFGNVPTREELMADIPLTKKQQTKSNHLIENSLMEMGLLFKDRLENYPKSIEALEDLLSRYPHAETKDQALVALYNAYRLNGDEKGMTSAKKRLEAEFPDSRFVAYLNDPDFFKKLDQVRRKRAKAYEKTYEDFLFGRFKEVISQSTKAISADDENPLVIKHYLLRALSEGKLGNTKGFKTDLEQLMAQAPETQEARLAEALLQHLKEGKTPVQGTLYAATPQTATSSQPVETVPEEGTKESESTQFVFVDGEPYDLVVMRIDADNMNRAIYNVADYNFSRYLLQDFELKEQTLINGDHALIVSGFGNKNEAMDYFYSLRERPEFFRFDYFKDNIIVISQSNQNKFYLSGLINEYVDFFNTYYLTPISKKELDKVRKEDKTTVQAKEDTSIDTPPLQTVEDTSKVTTPEPIAEEAQPTKETKKEEIKSTTEESPVPEQAKVEVENKPLEKKTVKPPIEPEHVSPYQYEASAPHSVLIVVVKTRMDYKRLQTIFTNYTRNKHGNKLSVNLTDLGNSYRAIQIDGFSNTDEARSYTKEVKTDPFLTRDIARREHYIWEISTDNLNTFLKETEIEAYEKFYKANY